MTGGARKAAFAAPVAWVYRERLPGLAWWVKPCAPRGRSGPPRRVSVRSSAVAALPTEMRVLVLGLALVVVGTLNSCTGSIGSDLAASAGGSGGGSRDSTTSRATTDTATIGAATG